MTKSTTG